MSFFVVIVPTREYEVQLRQKELNLVVQFAEETAALKQESTLIPSDSDLYRGTTKDGHQAEIIVGDDYMEVMSTNSSTKSKKNSVKSGTGTVSSSTPPQQRADQEPNDDITIQHEIDKYFLEKHLEDTLSRLHIINATWTRSVGGNMCQVTFPVSLNATDPLITRFHSVGIGSKYQSSVTVCTANVYFGPHKDADTKKANELSEGDDGDQNGNSGWSEFVKSIKSRLTVAQVISQIQSNAVLTFDFLLLVIVAAFIATLGLVENSTVILVSSMLISPMMGPIMAFTFGTVIRSLDLVKIGIRSEVVGLAICLVVGFLVGACLQLNLYRFVWASTEKWPTEEMVGRGKLRGIVVGAAMAIPSGIGVALSILAGNAGSLVGVAIAASLLPPAVNCGLFWGLGFVTWMKLGINSQQWHLTCNVWTGPDMNSTTEYFVNHKQVFCENVPYEYFYLGIVSFGLTGINIVIIFIVAIFILKIKEVAPYTTRQSLRRFWKEDLAYTRKYMKQHTGEDISTGIMADISMAKNVDGVRLSLDNDVTLNQIHRKMGLGGGATSVLNYYKSGVNINQFNEHAINLPKHRKAVMADAQENADTKKDGWFSWMGFSGTKT